MLPKQWRHKNMIYFIEKMKRLHCHMKFLVIKRKLIVKAKHSRIKARDLYRQVDD